MRSLIALMILFAGCAAPLEDQASVTAPSEDDLVPGLYFLPIDEGPGAMIAQYLKMDANPGRGEPNPYMGADDGSFWDGTTPPHTAHYAAFGDEDDAEAVTMWAAYEFSDAATAADAVAKVDICRSLPDEDSTALLWGHAVIIYDFESANGQAFSVKHSQQYTDATSICP